jgi:two-component system nitrogen regulation sensor histidine kinase NtrY
LKTTTKIRWLLLIVTIGLFATSLTARWAATRSLNLEDAAEKISETLAKKETFIYSFINDPIKFSKLKTLNIDAELALKTIDHFRSNDIYFQIFKNNNLVFWSDNKVSDKYATNFKEGTGFVGYSNGWYQTVKKGDDAFFAVFYIPIKSNYPYKNQFLNNDYSIDIIKDPTIDVAELSDKNVANISLDNKYLFSIKRTSSPNNIPYSKMEILLWVVGFLTLALLINSIFKFYADKGHVLLSVIGISFCFFIIRFLCISYHFPQALYSLEVFSPTVYASSNVFPSLADLALNIVSGLWITVFLYSYKEKLFKPIENKWLGYFLITISAGFIAFLSYTLSDIFSGLVFNSNINFKVTNLVNLNGWSILGILILLITLLTYYLIVEVLVYFSYYIKISLNTKIALFIGLLVAFNIYQVFFEEYNVFFLLVFLLILVVGRVVYQLNGSVIFPALILITLIFATIVSIKLNTYENLKEREMRKTLAMKLESADDPNALILFAELENQLYNDNVLKEYFRDPQNAGKRINSLFKNNYLRGYLSGYEFKLLAFDKDGISLNPDHREKLSDFKFLVEAGSLKVSKNFYRVNNTFGIQNYFAIIPIKEGNGNLGSLIIELKSKEIREFGTFPQLLKDGKLTFIEDYVDYSYAYYANDKLIYQSGNYVYDLLNKDYVGKLKDFVVKRKDGYSHMIYKTGPGKLIVISKEVNTFWREIASLSFFFIIFLLFGIVILSYKWIWTFLTSYKFNFSNFRLKLLLNSNKMLYKTRIQIALVMAVVTSLIIVGLITFSYISIQYKEQQESLIKERIKIIASAFKNKIQHANNLNDEEYRSIFADFSKMYNADLNMYDRNGILLSSTQSKIYNIGILAGRMDPNAFVYMRLIQKSEFIQNEHLGELKYISAYMPILNAHSSVVGYLQLPYFSNQNEFNQKIGNFLNLLVNIYVLVFVAIGFFAFVVANQITSPLTLIQDSMAKTAIGRKNKPILWKRNDEIGNLISEYNKMILALDESANRLAQSERETAWREMAKQVAHEIKNPLTPLRLGIQMLNRSWKEEDPNFDLKFQKFSKSFIEQIDSLSNIASEFSNFAKMPDLKLEKFEILTVLNQAVQIYKQMDHIQIFCNEEALEGVFVKADKDQLLRSFNNLLKNAIEAMPEEKDGLITIHCQLYETKVEIKIQDNGSGIPELLRERIFTPNFTTKSSGTGLGLAFVKQAIENIGGNIYFTTEINVGTSFHIILPRVS